MIEKNKTSQGFSLNKLLPFLRSVRTEINRVTWPSAPDTRRMTLMVFILASIIAVFLLCVDLIIGWSLSTFLGLGA